MARYIGPVCRLCRRFGDKMMLKGSRCLTPKCGVERHTRPPGQTTGGRPRRLSDRGLQLREKQKARFDYGLMERQFRRFVTEAERMPGITGDNLMILLERRFDNVVFQLGFGDSRVQARQLVRHGHITLNGHRADVPSQLVKNGDVIGWREGSTKNNYYKQLVETIGSKVVPRWLELDRQQMVGKVVSLPAVSDIAAKFTAKSIVEYYSR
jgi:small subunit ribosomal protein S4